MKFEKVALKKSWQTPVLRRIALTDDLLRKLEEKNGPLPAGIRQKLLDAQ